MQHLIDRFISYVTIDTESDANSSTTPSTAKQLVLANKLAEELKSIGMTEVTIDQNGYVMGTLASNVNHKVPTIGFVSHYDTSPDFTGANVNPRVVKNYDGGDIVLNKKENIVLSPSYFKDLLLYKGQTLIVTDGLTLLGADDKAGLTEIVSAMEYLIQNPHIKHGKIRVGFTPDEEIGRGVDKVNMKKLGARYGYTIDGETAGSIEDETFSADGAVITVNGIASHPGFAKGKMENALKIAARIVAKFPDKLSPEHTEGKEGFIHPVHMEGNLEKAVIKLIIRDFSDAGLKRHAKTLQKIVDGVLKQYPHSSAEISITEQYRNMGKVLRRHPHVVEYAMEALQRAGFGKPLKRSIRGGTDGSRLSFMGLPCPNIFAGEHAFHSKQEWVSVQDMEKAAETIVHLAGIWEEHA